jgi:ketosteroid isomerase-like protein
MESPMSNTETVKAIYEAFGRGDVTTILDKLDDAVEWETTVPLSDVPWLPRDEAKRTSRASSNQWHR